MGSHYLDRPVGSDLSYAIAKFRREHPELVAAERDSSNQRLCAINTKPSVFDGFIADRNVAVDEATWQRRCVERRQNKLG